MKLKLENFKVKPIPIQGEPGPILNQTPQQPNPYTSTHNNTNNPYTLPPTFNFSLQQHTHLQKNLVLIRERAENEKKVADLTQKLKNAKKAQYEYNMVYPLYSLHSLYPLYPLYLLYTLYPLHHRKHWRQAPGGRIR